jgi:RHS repeat-associated protein
MSVYYTTVAGEIVSENRNGVESFYTPDTNANTMRLRVVNGIVADEWTYWPYGEGRTRTVTTPTPFTFGGVVGSYAEQLGNKFYIRARYLQALLARWLTVDPLWPDQSGYVYVSGQVTILNDPSGTDSDPSAYGPAFKPIPRPKPPTPCRDLIKYVPSFAVYPYIKCLKELGPGATAQQLADCLDELPNTLKSQITRALCDYMACIANSPSHPPTDPCSDPSVDPIYCCASKYMSKICQCAVQYSKGLGLASCLLKAYTYAIYCAETWND